ncbi:hypothetical protein MNBD_GAMMA25-35 [hydrothermal vent metagenome]|uniref:O-antigen ligase-related domain-containing protein n=1 Tax=hydrothermal vent metagenome TaxID=652676 RepID=A0A3B1BV74_9ZZZZ
MEMNLSRIKNCFPSQGVFPEKALFVLLFLFPILSLSVRHWLSGAFTLIALLSLVYAWSSLKLKPFQREEKVLFAIFGFYFFSILLSSTVTGWSESSFHRLGTEMKYLAFFPFYLYIRQYPAAWRGLIIAIPLGGIVLGLQAIYDTYFLQYGRANGIYGPIIYGDLAVLLAMFSLIFALTNRSKLWVGINFLAAILAMLAVIYSGSRNAWLAVIVSLIVLPLLISVRTTFWRVSSGYVAILAVFVIMIVSTPHTITSRFGIVADEFKSYFHHDLNAENDSVYSTSVGIRLEMWRSALIIIKQHPLLGVGPGNMGLEMNALVEKGEAPQTVYRDPAGVRGIHVHNAYFEVMGTQGIIGLLALLLMLFYPLYVFVHNRHYDRRIASLGIVLMSGFMIFSLTEIPFIHDNFSSIFLTFLSVFFAWIMHAKYHPRTA